MRSNSPRTSRTSWQQGLGSLLCLAGLSGAEWPATAGWEQVQRSAEVQRLQPAGRQRANALALFWRGLREEQRGLKESALATYQAAMALDLHNVKLAVRMAGLMAGMGKYNAALALMEQAKLDNVEHPAAWLELCRYCLREHHGAAELKAKALQVAKQAVEIFPNEVACYRQLMDAYEQLQVASPRTKAREVLARAAQATSTDPSFWLALIAPARAAYPLDDPDSRAANLEEILHFVVKAEQFAGPDAAVQERLAYFYQDYAAHLKSMTLGKRAVPWFELLTNQHPENLPARRAYAALLRQMGEAERAQEMFTELVRIDPQDLTSHRALLKAAEQAHDARGIITHRTELIRWEGGQLGAWLDLAAAMVQEHQPQAAWSLLKRARFAYPEEAVLLLEMARVESDDAAAFTTFQAAVALAEKYPDAASHPRNATLLSDGEAYCFGAALAAKQPNEAEHAAAWFRRAMTVAQPQTSDLTARCSHGLATLWLARREHWEEAGELLRTAQSLVPDSPLYQAALTTYEKGRKP